MKTKKILAFQKKKQYKLCWEERGFISPFWHSPFIPYSHLVILLQSPKMSKSAFNLDLALFDFSSLSSGTKPFANSRVSQCQRFPGKVAKSLNDFFFKTVFLLRCPRPLVGSEEPGSQFCISTDCSFTF